MAGKVLVRDEPITKAGTQVATDAQIRLRGEDHPFVSRGGLKLDGALDDMSIEINGKIVLDIGASTGGFSDVCLRRGAQTVYAVDVGTNQLDYRMRSDDRVISLEQTNARHLTLDMLPGPADIAVVDVSFISIIKVLEAIDRCLKPNSAIVAMVKPQFEVGRGKVGKGGVVRDDETREEAVEAVVAAAKKLGYKLRARADSRILGPKGNKEIFVHLVHTGLSSQ